MCIHVGPSCSHMLIVGNLCLCRSLRNKIEVSHEARRRAASLPVLLSHGISTYLYILNVVTMYLFLFERCAYKLNMIKHARTAMVYVYYSNDDLFKRT